MFFPAAHWGRLAVILPSLQDSFVFSAARRRNGGRGRSKMNSGRKEEKKQEKYRLRGTPEIVINGKYRISGRSAGSQSDMLKVASFLIEKERNTSK